MAIHGRATRGLTEPPHSKWQHMSDTATGGHGDVRAHPMLMEQNHGWRMVRLSNTWALVYLGQTASTVIYYRGFRDCGSASTHAYADRHLRPSRWIINQVLQQR